MSPGGALYNSPAVERRSRGTPGSVKKRKLSPERRREATQRRPTYNGEDRSEAELRAGVGACFLCLRHFETMPYSEPRFMPPLRGSHLFFGAVPGVPPLAGLHRGLLYGAPPGLRIRLPSSLLRSYAEAGANARKIYPPSPLQLRIYRAHAELIHLQKTPRRVAGAWKNAVGAGGLRPPHPGK